MLHLLYSGDYELFLGANHRPEEEVLLEPAEALLRTCEEAGIHMTLFCDTACLWRYREWRKNAFPDAVEHQLADAVNRGHDVQAHLHPHWLKAEVEDGTYRFDPEFYLLGTFFSDPAQALEGTTTMLTRAADMLNRSREDLAYTIIDIDGAISEKTVEKIRGIEGVLMVRII